MLGGTLPSQMNHMQTSRTLWGLMAINMLLVVLKVIVAAKTGAVAAWAEVVFGVLHAAATVIALWGIHNADEPPDERHPYGHYRFESLAACAVGVLTAVGLVELVRAMWDTLFGQREKPEIDSASVVLILVIIAINLASCLYSARARRVQVNQLLENDSARNVTDAIGLSVLLLACAVMQLGWYWVDVLAAGFVGYTVARTAMSIVKENAAVLMDTARLDPQMVRAIAMGVPGVLDAYAIRSRGASGHVSLDLSIQVDPSVTVAAAHLVTHRVQDALESRLPELVDVVVHTEPGGEGVEK